MNHTAPLDRGLSLTRSIPFDRHSSGRHRCPEDASRDRLRSASTIAVASAILAAMPAALMTGSLLLALLIAIGTVVGVGFAGIVI